jgi:formylglycine-generating enzyme required for sulfatase activity
MTKRILGGIFLILSAFSIDSQVGGGKKKLYLSKINVMSGVPDVVRNSIVNRIKLNVIEKFGDKYYIVSDSDVALMNQKAAQLQKQGCSDEVCMKQIADAIDADEIVYGDVIKEGEKVKFQFTNINRDKNTFSMTTKSVAEVAFFESQYDHFVREATFKLIDPKYKINMNVEIKADDTISVKTINLGKVDGLDLSVLDFKSNDSAIANILDYLKEELRKGDAFFTNKSYKEARENYQNVIQKVQSKLTSEKRSKLKSFEASIVDRIGSTYVISIKEEWIEYYDKWLGQLKNANEVQLKQILKGYSDTESEIDRVPEEFQSRLQNLRKGVDERKESLEIALVGIYETKGDNLYKENRFEDAYKMYVDGKTQTYSLRDPKKKEVEQKISKKIEITRKTGENYVKNTVRTYLDQAEYLNLQDKTKDAKTSLELAKKAMEDSLFTPPICQEWYKETAGVLGVSVTSLSPKKEYIPEVVSKDKTFINSIGMEFVKIPEGSFLMGCSSGDTECEDDEKPQHKVIISKSFYMGKFEVTQGQWKKVMNESSFLGFGGKENNPSYFKSCGDDCPVESVSWNDVQEYIKKLCKLEKMNPCNYRLPTEAEWEYSAKAGGSTRSPTGGSKYYWGDSINDEYLWYDGNLGKTTHPVGKKKPNSWGLYDMSGNVWEWAGDWHDSSYYKNSPSTDPKGANSGDYRSLRGGSWNNNARYSRLSYRNSYDPDGRYYGCGFRLLLLP